MKSKATTKTVPIDSDRLKQTIRDHNYLIHDLSVKLGYGKSYLSRFTSGANTDIPTRTVALLETVGIHYEDYKADEKPVVKWDYPEGFAEQPKTFTSGTLTVRLDEDQMAQLCVMIREQVYEALARIWGVEK